MIIKYVSVIIKYVSMMLDQTLKVNLNGLAGGIEALREFDVFTLTGIHSLRWWRSDGAVMVQ